MRVLILHSDVAADAAPDEQDTLATANAVAGALRERGHEASMRAFVPDPRALARVVAETEGECVFNLVESVFGQGDLAGVAAAMLERQRIPFTGVSAGALACAADKPLTKRILRACGLPTPDWCEPPDWDGLNPENLYVVKAANEDASLGLDDHAVVKGLQAVAARASDSAARYGGHWIAEAYCPGREFNLSLLGKANAPRVLPIAEICFENWLAERTRIVGYAAKWDTGSPDCLNTPRAFGIEQTAPRLGTELATLALAGWTLLGLRGYARVDIRLDAAGAPMILEINPNPCLEPGAGFAAAARESGMNYHDLVEHILRIAPAV